MKTGKSIVSIIAAVACALALVAAVGCSSPSASSASSADASTSAASASASASGSDTQSTTASDDAPSTEASSTAASQQSESASSSQGSSDVKADGYQTFTGTVRIFTTKQLVEFQNADQSLFPAEGTYAVLIFDEPTEVTGIGGGDPDERTEVADMLGIAEFTNYDTFIVEYGNIDAMEHYDNKHVTIEAKDILFPSDVSLPIGQPRASDVKIVS